MRNSTFWMLIFWTSDGMHQPIWEEKIREWDDAMPEKREWNLSPIATISSPYSNSTRESPTANWCYTWFIDYPSRFQTFQNLHSNCISRSFSLLCFSAQFQVKIFANFKMQHLEDPGHSYQSEQERKSQAWRNQIVNYQRCGCRCVFQPHILCNCPSGSFCECIPPNPKGNTALARNSYPWMFSQKREYQQRTNQANNEHPPDPKWSPKSSQTSKPSAWHPKFSKLQVYQKCKTCQNFKIPQAQSHSKNLAHSMTYGHTVLIISFEILIKLPLPNKLQAKTHA